VIRRPVVGPATVVPTGIVPIPISVPVRTPRIIRPVRTPPRAIWIGHVGVVARAVIAVPATVVARVPVPGIAPTTVAVIARRIRRLDHAVVVVHVVRVPAATSGVVRTTAVHAVIGGVRGTERGTYEDGGGVVNRPTHTEGHAREERPRRKGKADAHLAACVGRAEARQSGQNQYRSGCTTHRVLLRRNLHT